MKVKRYEVVNGTIGTMLSKLILHTLSRSCLNLTELAEKDEFEVKLLIEGEEMDLKEFVDYWQSQVTRFIVEEAKDLMERKVSNSFGEVFDMLQDFQERLYAEIDKYKEEWEKELEGK